jgi:hypothetical protein
MRNTAPKSNFALRPEGGNGPNRRILPQKFFDLIKIPSLDPRCCFAMADNIGCNEIIERIRLTAVPYVEETPDYGLVLLRRCAHGEVPSVIIPACIGTGAPRGSRT